MAGDRLSTTLSALADPTRSAILERLVGGEATLGESAEPFPISLQAVSKHLKVLERAGLITQAHSAQWRPCRLRSEPLGQVIDWLEDRRFWDASFDRLEDHLRTVQANQEGARDG